MGALLGLVRTHRRSLEQTSAGGEIDDEMLVGTLGRLLAELEAPMRAGEIECDDGQGFDDLVARLDELRDQLGALTAREEAEAAGIEHVARTPVIAPQQKVEQPRSSKPTRAASREQRASADAVAPTPVADAGGWRLWHRDSVRPNSVGWRCFVYRH
jgi:hypothetical protein